MWAASRSWEQPSADSQQENGNCILQPNELKSANNENEQEKVSPEPSGGNVAPPTP